MDRTTNLVDLKGLAGVTAQHHEYLHHDLSLCFWRAVGKVRGSVSYVKRENKMNSTTCQRSRAKFPPICNYVGNIILRFVNYRKFANLNSIRLYCRQCSRPTY